jgi:hypothetical protein
MRVDRAKFGLAILLVVFVFLILTGFFWNFVRDTIAVPIYYLIWVSDLTLKSIPQSVFLGILVVLCVLIGSSALLAIRVNEDIESAEPKPVQSQARYHFWRNLCVQLDSSAYSREKFTTESRKLILSILAYQEGIESAEAEALVSNGALGVPETIRNLILRQHIQLFDQVSRTEDNSVLARLRRIFGEAALPQVDRQVDEIIGFIEQLLEIGDAGEP